jgi:GTP cyclohydrolase II
MEYTMSSNLNAAHSLSDESTPRHNSTLSVEIYARAALPSQYGQFEIVAFKNNRDENDHVAIVHGDPCGASGVLTRIHSECLTGDVFGSLKCDCGPQLDLALQEIAGANVGVVLYMRQEGRGIGLANKVKAYSLQDLGMDTVEANHHLGFDDDLRDYEISAEMLKLLGIESIVLMTNNPSKVEGLWGAGVVVDERRPIKTTPNPHNYNYLETKRIKSGHLL